MVRVFSRIFAALIEVLLLAPALLAAISSRWARREIDVGLGPEPLVNWVYHKRALESAGLSAETYVDALYYITAEFDRIRVWPRPWSYFARWWGYLQALRRYRCLFFSFSGGSLGNTQWIWRLEPLCYRLAGIRTVILPYGSDVQDMSRCPNPLFKAALSKDYPQHRLRRREIRRRVDLWTRHADHVTAGCDWVDYLYHWDSLSLGHFSVEIPSQPARANPTNAAIRVVHAPNHRAIKGTAHLLRAVDDLKAEGISIELTLIERKPNREVLAAIENADIVADQFVIGWYAMFALEGMARGKPVLCYVRPDLERFYVRQGLLADDELPLARTSIDTLTDDLRRLCRSRDLRRDLGQRSLQFVKDHHSVESVGRYFSEIHRSLGLRASGRGHGEKP